MDGWTKECSLVSYPFPHSPVRTSTTSWMTFCLSLQQPHRLSQELRGCMAAPSVPQQQRQSFPMGLFLQPPGATVLFLLCRIQCPAISGAEGRANTTATSRSCRSGWGALEALPSCTGILFHGRWGRGQPGLPLPINSQVLVAWICSWGCPAPSLDHHMGEVCDSCLTARHRDWREEIMWIPLGVRLSVEHSFDAAAAPAAVPDPTPIHNSAA